MNPALPNAIPGVADAIVAAVIGAIAGWVATLVKLGPERQRLRSEIALANEQAEKFRIETQQLRDKKLVAEREIEEVRKLTLERQRLEEDLDAERRQRIDNERSQIIELLKAFDREVFDAPLCSEEPVAMFLALRQTRIWLQTSGALYFRDMEIANEFRVIRRLLAETERNIIIKYPAVSEMAQEPDDKDHQWGGRRGESEARLGRQYYEAVNAMMETRRSILDHVNSIRARIPSYPQR